MTLGIRLRRFLASAAARAAIALLYRPRVLGREHLPRAGPALLASNHVSFLDPLLLQATLPFSPWFVLNQEDRAHLRWLARALRTAPWSRVPAPGSRPDLDAAREQLRRGGVAAIFPEGTITRTGHLLPFDAELARWLEQTSVPIVPVWLEGVRGGWLSVVGNRLLRQPPTRRRKVVIAFGAPLPPGTSADALWQAMAELAADVAAQWHGPGDRLERRFLRTAKRRRWRLALADSTGRRLSFFRTLVGALLLAGWLRNQRRDERMVGILLPASVGAAVANIAVLLGGKIPVNLNFTAGCEVMDLCIRQCDLKTVLTSRAFLSRVGLPETPPMVFLEDLAAGFSRLRKLGASLTALLSPASLLERLYGGAALDEPAAVIFSSGSTAEPKAVLLSHRNIVSNLDSLLSIFPFPQDARVLGVLPFFHVFGLTCTLWCPLLAGYSVMYHPNPTEARTIGELASSFRPHLLMATPTFFAQYLRRCERGEFASLLYAIAGGEKLPLSLAQAFREKFGHELLEGYGATEMSPVIAVNVPNAEVEGSRQQGQKPGSVGRPIPGVAVRIVDPDTGEPLPRGRIGLLLVKGPGRMLGYFNAPERTQAVLRQGWYVTGDLAALDPDGFLVISDRLSRFSKIGGEMVPHVRVEQAAAELLDGAPCAVMAAPDPERGERLVLLYARPDVSPDELWRRLQQSALPKLWIPKRENIYRVAELPPPLASGKLDLRRLRALALEMVSRSRSAGAG